MLKPNYPHSLPSSLPHSNGMSVSIKVTSTFADCIYCCVLNFNTHFYFSLQVQGQPNSPGYTAVAKEETPG